MQFYFCSTCTNVHILAGLKTRGTAKGICERSSRHRLSIQRHLFCIENKSAKRLEQVVALPALFQRAVIKGLQTASQTGHNKFRNLF